MTKQIASLQGQLSSIQRRFDEQSIKHQEILDHYEKTLLMKDSETPDLGSPVFPSFNLIILFLTLYLKFALIDQRTD
jgi:hypothetical protein